MGTLEVGLNVLFNYAIFRYGPHRLMCLKKPMGARGWNVMDYICLAQGVALVEGVALLEEVCHSGGGLGDTPPSCLRMLSLFLASFG